MKKIGLFFGSFNPIHIGHLILANYILENSDMNELWFVVSPQNPFKEKKSLLKDHNRLDMVELAIKNYPDMRASNVEFSLPTPSYTIDTLTYLKEKHPDYSFSLIMGEDNLESLHKWKNSDLLIKNHHIIVYPRVFEGDKKDSKYINHENISLVKAPVIELSATEIRNMIQQGKNVRPMLPPEVFEYLDGSSFYK
ncbi:MULTISPECIES: nicotinate (nicotinamide) nucleotide adenylyltransferase [Chryseobacterium]|jgi:nicotinate-nucleotide adenylyltransferase|uniref:Probable nicotinate-nucleotide adenylyltransferase n=1 Tax=Chryseobacterium balustinum TaxID=246 RepID=A0AAX2IQB5_9FLAO|nr:MULTISPECIES: nicotinate (nicotinamide) nucleotide adenylyltransferase [Chryseobacterium]AZB30966.1 nicotinate-nucleotide adenylyltransferase [Chryseobacterium balustinum]MDY0931903.1 nicotinate (nicotinamide) nucleotide adenylyltransferase [Chryseobacterium sp. CFBP8996]SKB42167.1 nicotinate-nucleotide adenylyltransferase [Chryseobacterium balustinum]SQA92181.1 Nicotinate-nucleotide adenylyltransferase [Chryseobacterium balustinum]